MAAQPQLMGDGEGLQGITVLQLAAQHQPPQHREQLCIDQLWRLEALGGEP
jgi:hypothetical protein